MSDKKIHSKDAACPRDHIDMARQHVGDAELDVCAKCGGQFFDSGEMFKAFGLKADPSYWDRPETGGSVKGSDLHCPRCRAQMLGQDVRYETQAVEIDRCGHCGGVWLDKGEVETIIAIGDRIAPVLAAKQAEAQAELAKLGDPSFAPGLIARFLRLFRRG